MGGDAVEIAEKVARGFADEFGKTFEGFTDAGREKLLAHDWPGNVRELRNVLERALIFAQAPRLDAADLVLMNSDLFDAPVDEDAFSIRSGATLEEVERDYIRHTLIQNKDSSYADVADMLGISKKTLWEKRKRYDLDAAVAAA